MDQNNNYYYQEPPQEPPRPQYEGPHIENRNIALYIILSIITCGIFGLYWLYCIVTDLNAASNEQNPTSGGMVIVFTIITCSIYWLYWLYKAGQQVSTAKQLRNLQPDSNASIIYLVLGIFQLGIVSYALIQNELNSLSNLENQH